MISETCKQTTANGEPKVSQKQLEKCDIYLSILNGSKDSIVKTSSFLMKIAHRDPQVIPQLIELWRNRIIDSPAEKKVVFIYLANDLIQNSKIQSMRQGPAEGNQGKTFWQEFKPVLTPTFMEILNQAPCDSNIMAETIRVIEVWKQRQIYDLAFIDDLLRQIQQAGPKNDQNQRSLKESEFEGLHEKELNQQWVDLAEMLAYSQERSLRIDKLEQLLNSMVGDLSGVDEVELECKVDEYKKLCECQSDEKKKILGLANAVHPKLDNQIFQMILTLQRIDESIARVSSASSNVEGVQA